MKIQTTINFEHRLEDDEIERFKAKVLERIKEYIDEDTTLTVDDLPNDTIEAFFKDEIPYVLEDIYKGYGHNDGVEVDDYFGTINFDYCGETVRDWVQEVADIIMADKEEE